MKQGTHVAFSAAAILLGLYHLQIAGNALLVFHEGESLWSWLSVLSGPAATLPAGILALLRPRIGGASLIVGGVISFISSLVLEGGITGNSAGLLLWVTIPMVGLGGGVLAVARKQAR
jgi:hypothetical protein